MPPPAVQSGRRNKEKKHSVKSSIPTLRDHLPLTLALVFVDTRISKTHGDTERSVLILDTGIVPHCSSMVPSLMSLSLLPNDRLSLAVLSGRCALIGWCPLISPELDFCARIMKVSWQWWCVSVCCHLGEIQHWTKIERQPRDVTKPDWAAEFEIVLNSQSNFRT